MIKRKIRSTIMKYLSPLLLFVFLLNFQIFAQLPYTQAEYEVSSMLDVNYGAATDYAGTEVALLMDIYKPVEDNNCKRPIMILAHGGAWVTDDKANESLQFMSNELAKRGWVVANINYRLGMNNTDDYSTNAFCTGITEPCAFIADSMEVERANFRAMQDAKGAIRFMKNRNVIDSTDIDNVFMAGESAGGFISLSAGFSDDISKKPASCFAIDDAVAPDPDFEEYGCSDSNNNLSRPDLGDIEGLVNLGDYDSSLKGVGSFFGGTMDINLFDEVSNPPGVYLYHQSSDVIINYDYGRMFQRISDECFAGICQGYGPFPFAFGGEGIRKHFDAVGASAPLFFSVILDNMGAGDCFSNGHGIDDPEQRLQSMTDFFAERIAESGNLPSSTCSSVGIDDELRVLENAVINNPIQQQLSIKIPPEGIGTSCVLVDISGKRIFAGSLRSEETSFSVSNIPNGIYFLKLSHKNATRTEKIVKN